MQIVAIRFSEGLLRNRTMQITNICLNQCNIAAYSPMKLKHDVHAEADGDKKRFHFWGPGLEGNPSPEQPDVSPQIRNNR